MPKITKIVTAIPFTSNNAERQIFRVIGSTDINGNGTQHEIHDIDPIIFLDEAWMATNTESIFKAHPHMGLVAVSYILEGAIQSWDNINGDAKYKNEAEGVYYINTGRGIVHNESAVPSTAHLHWLQLWFNPGIYNLPLSPAKTQLIRPGNLPEYFIENGTSLRVVIGSVGKYTSPVLADWPLLYLHAKIPALTKASLPLFSANCRGFIYIVKGKSCLIENTHQAVKQQCIEINADGTDAITLENTDNELLECIIVSGMPHNKPFCKLLGHGGALVGPDKASVVAAMQEYEADPENFGRG